MRKDLLIAACLLFPLASAAGRSPYMSSEFCTIRIIGDGGKEKLFRVRYVAGLTVFDALRRMEDPLLQSRSAKVWVCRPFEDMNEVLPVDWAIVGEGKESVTNYALQAGDTIFATSDFGVKTGSQCVKCFAPLERILGYSENDEPRWVLLIDDSLRKIIDLFGQ